MASIGTVTGSKFIGSPIVYPVIPGSIPSGAVFHRVRLTVKVNGAYDFEFSTPVNGQGVVNFDISSALCAVADNYVPRPTEYTYQSYSYSMTAYDDYLLDGKEYIGANPSATESQSGLYVGKLTDRERLTGERPVAWSRKPVQRAGNTPEVVFVGCEYLLAGPFSSAPAVQSQIVAEGIGTQRTYPIAKPRDGYVIFFINSLGVHESIHVQCLMQGETAIATDRHVIARQETIAQFSRGVSIKQNDHETWKMSSGPLDRQWQQWYIHEVLMARWAWIKIDNAWLPIHILPDETVPGIDRQKASLLEVPFSIEFDINGSPFA